MRLGKEDRQRHRREAAAAPHVEDTGAGIERTDLGNGERMQHMAQVELVEILARDDVDLGVPVGVEAVQGGELLPLQFRQAGEIFVDKFHADRFFRGGGQFFSPSVIRRHICSRARCICVLTVPSGNLRLAAISS